MPPPTTTRWEAPPGRLQLKEGEAHVWRVYLNQGEAARRALWDTLAEDERGRAGRFYFRIDREYFVTARGALRDILGRYLDAPPARLRFSYTEYGKPALEGGAGLGALQFNVSHSHRVALYAVTRSRAVGVDVELVCERNALPDVAERFFSAREVAMLRALPAAARTAAFFNCWTRKEAYIKAIGEGLSHPLHGFTVSLAPGSPAALLATEADPAEASRWSLAELSPGPRYAGALAVEGGPPSLRLWQWGDARRPRQTE